MTTTASTITSLTTDVHAELRMALTIT